MEYGKTWGLGLKHPSLHYSIIPALHSELPLVKSDGDVIQEASRRRNGSIEKCTNVWRMMKTADSEEKKLRKNSVNTAVKIDPEV